MGTLRIYIVLFGVAALTVAISAEFSWSQATDDFWLFLKDWSTTWIPSTAALAVAYVALRQVQVIRRGQRTEYAPVLRLDLSIEKDEQPSKPEEGRYADPLEDYELDWRREDGGAQPEFLLLKIRNLQKHAAGAAFGVEIQVTLYLPIDEFPFGFSVGHLQPDATEFHTLVNLAGLKWSRVVISLVDFSDSEGSRYSQAHGLAYLERDQDGKVEASYLTIPIEE